MTENQLKYLAYQETARHNAATEADATRKTDETMRSNRVNEGFRDDELTETHRANVARETENYRSNFAREQETRRSNTVHEGLMQMQTDETARHNRRDEEIRRGGIAAKAATDAMTAGAKWVDAFMPG